MPYDDPVELADLAMSTRLRWCLKNAGFRWAWQVRRSPDAVFMDIPNFGKVTLAELRDLVPYDLRGQVPLDDTDPRPRRELSARFPYGSGSADWIDVIAGVA